MRPLPLEMVQYARNDSHFLIPLYFLMTKMLDHTSFEKSSGDDGSEMSAEGGKRRKKLSKRMQELYTICELLMSQMLVVEDFTDKTDNNWL